MKAIGNYLMKRKNLSLPGFIKVDFLTVPGAAAAKIFGVFSPTRKFYINPVFKSSLINLFISKIFFIFKDVGFFGLMDKK
jgi:hypothetical protein